jgi:phage host-nuclease inhibitor protein Gam
MEDIHVEVDKPASQDISFEQAMLRKVEQLQGEWVSLNSEMVDGMKEITRIFQEEAALYRKEVVVYFDCDLNILVLPKK